ncbi:hypothetical protein, partial [Yersinia pestis]|uniref:hypothetical protein n=1 Tax=Yersinia pestis TaxID=632 RepID=UPI00037339D4
LQKGGNGATNWVGNQFEQNAEQMLELLRQNTELTTLTNQLTTHLKAMAVELHQKLVLNPPSLPPHA